MKILLLLAMVLLTSCATTDHGAAYDHSAQAPRRARHDYQHSQRWHQQHRRRAPHANVPWN